MAEPAASVHRPQNVVTYPPGLLRQIRRQCGHNATSNNSIILMALQDSFEGNSVSEKLNIVNRLRSSLGDVVATLTRKIGILRALQAKMTEYLSMDMGIEVAAKTLESNVAGLTIQTAALDREMEVLQSIQAKATYFVTAFEAEMGPPDVTQNNEPEADATVHPTKLQQAIFTPSLVVENSTSTPTQASMEQCNRDMGDEPDMAKGLNDATHKEDAPRNDTPDHAVEARHTGPGKFTAVGQTSAATHQGLRKDVHECDDARTPQAILDQYYPRSLGDVGGQGTILPLNGNLDGAHIGFTQLGVVSSGTLDGVQGKTFTREVVESDEEAQAVQEESQESSRAAAETTMGISTLSSGDAHGSLVSGNSEPEEPQTVLGINRDADTYTSSEDNNGDRYAEVTEQLEVEVSIAPEDEEDTCVKLPKKHVSTLEPAAGADFKLESETAQPPPLDAEFARLLAIESRKLATRANAEILPINDVSLVMAAASAKLREIAEQADEVSIKGGETDEGLNKEDHAMDDGCTTTLSTIADHSRAHRGENTAINLTLYHLSPPPEPGGSDQHRQASSTGSVEPQNAEVSTNGMQHISNAPAPKRTNASLVVQRITSASRDGTSDLSTPNSELADPFEDHQENDDPYDGNSSAEEGEVSNATADHRRRRYLSIIEKNWNDSASNIFGNLIPFRTGMPGRMLCGRLRRLSEYCSLDRAVTLFANELKRYKTSSESCKIFVTGQIVDKVLALQSPPEKFDLAQSAIPEDQQERNFTSAADAVETNAASRDIYPNSDKPESRCRSTDVASDPRAPRVNKRKYNNPYSAEELELLIKLKEHDKLHWATITGQFAASGYPRTQSALMKRYYAHKESAGLFIKRRHREDPSLVPGAEVNDPHTDSFVPTFNEAHNESETEERPQEVKTVEGWTKLNVAEFMIGNPLSDRARNSIWLTKRRIHRSHIYSQVAGLRAQNADVIRRDGLGYTLARWAKAIFHMQIHKLELLADLVNNVADVFTEIIKLDKLSSLPEKVAAVQDFDQAMTNFVFDKGGLGMMNTNHKVLPMVFGRARRAWISENPLALRCVEEMLAANPRPEKRGPVERSVDLAAKYLLNPPPPPSESMEDRAYAIVEAILAHERAILNVKVKQSALSSLVVALEKSTQAIGWNIEYLPGSATGSPKDGDTVAEKQHCVVRDERETAIADGIHNEAASPLRPSITGAAAPGHGESEEREEGTERSRPDSVNTDEMNSEDTTLDNNAQELENAPGDAIVETGDVYDYIDPEAHTHPQASIHKCDSVNDNGQRCNSLQPSAQLPSADLIAAHKMSKEDVCGDVCVGGEIIRRPEALGRHMRNVHPVISHSSPTTVTAAVHDTDITTSSKTRDSNVVSSNNGTATPSLIICLTVLEEEDVKQVVAAMLTSPPGTPSYPVEVGLAVFNGRADTIAKLRAVNKDLQAGINKYVADPSMREKMLSALAQAVREHMRAKGLVDMALWDPVPRTEQTQFSHEISTVETTDEKASTAPSTGPGETHLAPSMGDSQMGETAVRLSTLNSSGIDPHDVAGNILAAIADPRDRSATYTAFNIAMRYFRTCLPDTTAILEIIASELLQCISNEAKQLYPSRAKDCALEALGRAKAAYIRKIDMEAKVSVVGHSITTTSSAPDLAVRSILSSDLPPASNAELPPAALPSLAGPNSSPDKVAACILTARDATDMALQYLNSRKPETKATLETVAFELWQSIAEAANKHENRLKGEIHAHNALHEAMDIYAKQNNLESKDSLARTSHAAQVPAPVPLEMSISNSTVSPTRTAPDVPPSCCSDHVAAKSDETLLDCALPLTSSDASSIPAGVAPVRRSKSDFRKSDHTPAAAETTMEKTNACAAQQPQFTRAHEQSTVPDRLLDTTTKRDTGQLGTAIPGHGLEYVSGAPKKLQWENIVQPRKRRTEPRKKMAAPRTARRRDIDMPTQVQFSDSPNINGVANFVEEYEVNPLKLNIETLGRKPSSVLPTMPPHSHNMLNRPASRHASPSVGVGEMLAPVMTWDTPNKESKKRGREGHERRLKVHEKEGGAKDELHVLGDNEHERDIRSDVSRESKRRRIGHGVGVGPGFGA